MDTVSKISHFYTVKTYHENGDRCAYNMHSFRPYDDFCNHIKDIFPEAIRIEVYEYHLEDMQIMEEW